MTKMIYRGVTYTRTRHTQRAITKDLIYRGVAHDGMSEAQVARSAQTEMCYRGVRYTMKADGAIAWIKPQMAQRPTGSGAMQAA
ncbi:hypothetical protein FIU97_07165 [Roseivivax sp. THAF40]|uniref:DUF4278 domain-containing protein n=1 Tax=unclassified Roseivivax TaxID=2639302 RepID=UPI0012683952|nr:MULTISPECIES: DUF4278 domain-containing protein [unclassified Roseivivax]QFS82585.1 hypothetical protein FIV09_07065 [Roseivivax sp. THAF197b]QFT46354.1 hypothetical protein FIU97_07165 [Roseivivax sp. THAF40]